MVLNCLVLFPVSCRIVFGIQRAGIASNWSALGLPRIEAGFGALVVGGVVVVVVVVDVPSCPSCSS